MDFASAVVGPQILADGVRTKLRTDRLGALVTKDVTGRWAEAAHRDELYICSTAAAGVTIPIYSNTTQQFVLYNPLNSKFKYEILKAWVGYVSGTHVAGHLCWAYQPDLTKTVSGTAGLYASGRLANSAPASLQCLVAATVTAMTYLRPWKYSQAVATAASAITPWVAEDDTDGSIVIEPGSSLAIAANVAAAMVATVGALVREVPLAA